MVLAVVQVLIFIAIGNGAVGLVFLAATPLCFLLLLLVGRPVWLVLLVVLFLSIIADLASGALGWSTATSFVYLGLLLWPSARRYFAKPVGRRSQSAESEDHK